MGAIKCYLNVWRKATNFSGRASRSEYWWFWGINLLVSMILAGFDAVTGMVNEKNGYGFTGAIYTMASFLPWFAVTFRRAHDLNISTKSYLGLIVFAPMVIAMAGVLVNSPGAVLVALLLFGVMHIIFFFAFMKKGTTGPNRFGPDPLEPVAEPAAMSAPATTPALPAIERLEGAPALEGARE